MISLAHPDDVFLEFPRKRVTVAYDRSVRILWWTFRQRIRRSFTFTALPLGELIAVERQIGVAGKMGPTSLRAAGEVLVGRVARELPPEALSALLDAHYETSYPKAKAAGESPSASAPSSAASSEPPSTSPETESSPSPSPSSSDT